LVFKKERIMRQQRYSMGFERALSLVLIILVILSQVPELCARQATESKPLKLNIVIIEGDGAINNVKQRVAREVIVQVNDENNRPVAGGAVVFLLPNSGASGLFSNGANVLNVTTNAAGRATAQFTPNAVSGGFQINVSASFQGQVSNTVIPQTNALSAAGATAGEAATGVGTGTGVSVTTIAIIAAAVAGAVAVAVVARGKDNESPAPPLPSTTPTAPTIRIGGVGTPTIGTPGFQQAGRIAKPAPQWR
jgi:hypothetical protein